MKFQLLIKLRSNYKDGKKAVNIDIDQDDQASV